MCEEVVEGALVAVVGVPEVLVFVFAEPVVAVDDDEELPQADRKIDAAAKVIAAKEAFQGCRSVGLAFIDRSVGSSVRDAPSGTTN